MRVCIVYDCLFPWTIGGAERWYRNLAERLVAEGHEVTYVTRRQWQVDDAPDLPGIRVIAVSGPDELYGPDGNRAVAPPLRFGRGVLGHLLRHGGEYDVVHTASFPYFSVLAAGVARRRWGRAAGSAPFRLVVDWHELWSRTYWREYLGAGPGTVGWLVQHACVRTPQRAFTFSRLFRDRLVAEGVAGEVTVLEGEYAGDLTPPQPRPAEPLVVFAGRHIAEKRAPLAVAAIAAARARGADVRGLILGDGPERPQVLEAIAAHGLEGVVDAPGFVPAEEVAAALDRALCLLHPSSREGYGLVVVEASAHGTPVIVAEGEDNASVELVAPGENGYVAAPTADALADAIVAVRDAGLPLRERTCAWFAANAERLSLDRSLDVVAAAYGVSG
jgi:glycosyltransferase involved in cell wall biosynthesis